MKEIEENFGQIASTIFLMKGSKEVAQFVMAQSILETNHYKSNIYKKNNNLFGMKLAKTRLTTAHGENRGHAMYVNTETSLVDYMLWLTYNGFTQNTLKDLDKFKLRLINSGYCPQKDYIKRIEEIYNQIEIN